MQRRVELHGVLETILDSRNVYFQPPNNLEMEYPAIVYEIDDIENTFADNKVYAQSHAYLVTLIDEDPDSEYVKKISQLPTVRFNRHFVSDNLNHYSFTIHY